MSVSLSGLLRSPNTVRTITFSLSLSQPLGQVPLMVALPEAVAALGTHRGLAAVAKNGLCFLANLSRADANKVSWAQSWLCGLSLMHFAMSSCYVPSQALSERL